MIFVLFFFFLGTEDRKSTDNNILILIKDISFYIHKFIFSGYIIVLIHGAGVLILEKKYYKR